jgi:hypothetical protein
MARTPTPTTESHDPDDATGGRWRRRGRRLVGGALAAAAYWTLVRPRLLRWGATPAEVSRSLPGDDLLPEATAESTMAVTVDAPPAAVWPWLRQLGQDRGGFYSYEWAENLVGLDIHNADEIRPEYQSLSVGDEIRLARADRFPEATLQVAALDPERSLVLAHTAEPTGWVWSFVLDPVDEAATRLLVRSRVRLPENPVARVAAQSVLDPVTFVMTRGMLRGIRARAENLAATTAAPTTGPEP